mmetsp:Transcript_29186/g.82858  ORF Transcript_29186/g.82858 Transcript_29186/m.82858 type:complete len:108 (-) Transcript_29186:85-408(-)
MERRWIESSEHIIKIENAQVVIYAFPTVRCYKCPFCGPSSPLRTISGQARHFSICPERKNSMQHGYIANPRQFKFVGFTPETIASMTPTDGPNENRNESQQETKDNT